MVATLNRCETAAVFTVGHSNRGLETFLELLSAHGIERLVDVRSFPRSRHNPQFDLESLLEALPRNGTAYEHRPGLGGRRKASAESVNQGWRSEGFCGYADYMRTVAFEHEIESLTETSRRRRTAIMCAEALPWRCHRRLIADALLVRGGAVRHILAPGRADEHRLTSFAEVHGTRLTYPFSLSANDAAL